ncbi:MAG: hypothetical protein HY058_05935 [Proteobacteria bacterium]|nr:hypothetical protein [Pseudomonadota bacterium]
MFNIIDRLSLAAGLPANDDAYGGIGSPAAGAAWVIDGATGVGDQEYVPEAKSDAAWFALTLSRCMTREAMLGGDLEQQMRQAYRAANAAFAGVAGAAVPDYGRPLATLLAVAWQRLGDRTVSLEMVSLGDGKALLLAAPGPGRILGLQGEDQSDRQVNAAVQALHAGGTVDPDAVLSAMLGDLRRSRVRSVMRYANWAEGRTGATASIDRERLILTPPGTLLLVTDGFFRLVDTYGAYTPDSFIKAACVLGLADLGRELRQIEAADATCRRYPRLKPRDDATAILLAIEDEARE